MNKAIKWSLSMSDSDFVKASEEYFKRSRIDLHIGCCLLAKVDPSLKHEPVGNGYLEWDDEAEPNPYDYTRRPFLVALRALNGETPENVLVSAEPVSASIKNAKDIQLHTRTFVKWAEGHWGDGIVWIQKAEKSYQMAKATSPVGYLRNDKTPNNFKWVEIRKQYEDLCVSNGTVFGKMSIRSQAEELESQLKGTGYEMGWEVLRKRISGWIS